MARLRAGILGNLRGKVAGVVGSQWKDKNYIREYVLPANPNTAAQQAQRSKMTDVVAFAKPLVGPVFNAYTDRFQKSMSGFNFFIKKNIAEFDGTPQLNNIVVTEGKLSSILANTFTYDTADGNTILNWLTNLGNNGANDDKVFFAVYASDTGIWYFPDAETDRDTNTKVLTLPTGLTANQVWVYMWVAQYINTLVNLISLSKWDVAVAP